MADDITAFPIETVKVSELSADATFSDDDKFLVTAADGISRYVAGSLIKAWVEGEMTTLDVTGTIGATDYDVGEFIDFTPQAVAPSHVEARLYYDQEEKTLSMQTEIAGTTLNIGQEQYMKVINNSGDDILDGMAVRADDIDPIAALPQIVLGLADTLVHSRILGVVTNTIADGEEGYLTTFGKVNGLDTDTLITGLPLYLSSTVAGTYSTVAPANGILTQIGGCLVSDLTDGTVMVSIQNSIALPHLFGVMQETVMLATLSPSHQEIKPYTTGDSFGLTEDLTLGTMTLPNAGWYRFNMAGTFTASAGPPSGADLIEFELWDLTNSVQLAYTSVSITNTALTASRSVAIPFEIGTVDTNVVLRLWSDSSTNDLDFDTMSFDIESIAVEIGVA